jgi:predicted ABC-type ATPase
LPSLIIIAGPNGAGKTTFAREYLSADERGFEFVNADEIARSLGTPSDILAARIMLTRIDELVDANADFVIETTLANLTYAQKIPLWQRQGYRISLIYIRLSSVDVSLARVRKRVEAGGHDIPASALRRRFGRSQERAFVFHTIQVPGGYDSDPSKRLSVSFAHGISMLSIKSKEVSAEELSIWVKLLPFFTSLLKLERFRFAVSVASTLYVHPNPTVQVASIFSAIEALIDVDQELRFRISMIVAKLLTHTSSDRILLFKKMKKLYDARSKCVHGGGLDRDKVLACRDEALEFLRRLIIYAVERNEIHTREGLDELLVSS